MNDMSAKDLANLTGTYLKMVARKYGGETTLNELRVMNRMVALHFSGRVSGVTKLSARLGIHKSTVSRSVTNLTEKQHLREYVHPVDRRKRIVALSDSSIKDLSTETEVLLRAVNSVAAAGGTIPPIRL